MKSPEDLQIVHLEILKGSTLYLIPNEFEAEHYCIISGINENS